MYRVPVGLLGCLLAFVTSADAGHIQPDIPAEALSVVAADYANSGSAAPQDGFNTLLFSEPEYQTSELQDDQAPSLSDVEGPAAGSNTSAPDADLDESLSFFQSSQEGTSVLSGSPDQLTWSGNSSGNGIDAFSSDPVPGGSTTDSERDGLSKSGVPGEQGDSGDLTSVNSSLPLALVIPAVSTIANSTPAFLSTDAEAATGQDDKNSARQPYDSSSASSDLHVPEPSTLLLAIVAAVSVPLSVFGRRTRKARQSAREI